MDINHREISNFEQVYINKVLRLRRFEITLIKSLLYAFLAILFFFPLLIVLTTKMKLVVGLSLMMVIGFVLFEVRDFIFGLVNMQVTHEHSVTCQKGVIAQRTSRLTNPNTGYASIVKRFFIDGKQLFTPPGSEDVLTKCVGKEVVLSAVTYQSVKKRHHSEDKIFQQELILLALTLHDEILIDIHNMIKHHGRRVFMTHYINSLPIIIIMSLVYGPIIFYLCSADWLLQAPFWAWLTLFIGATLLGAGVSVFFMHLYDKCLKKIKPDHQNELMAYRNKLKGKPD